MNRADGWRLPVMLLAGIIVAMLGGWLASRAAATQDLGVRLAVGLGLAVAAGLLSWRLGRSIARPVASMHEAAERIAKGEWHVRVPARLSAEPSLRSLTVAFNAMVEQLDRRMRELHEERTQAEAVLESMVEGVVALDEQGRMLWLNASAQRLFNVSPGEAGGKRLLELFRQPEADALISAVLERRQPLTKEVEALVPPAQVLRLQATPCDGSSSGAALVVVAQDVTEMRRLEALRREFVANVSHELKTPLTSIKGLVETLLNGALEDPQHNRRFVSLIEDDAARLGRLIDDLLELSQIESKVTPLRLQPVSLEPLVHDLVVRFQPLIHERQLTVDVAIPAGMPPVHGDPDRVRQILSNLLDNAVKFNRPGSRVRIAAAVAGRMVDITVEDTGVGIPAEDLPRIFERFYRVDKARSRELGGTGLGLAIVKHLVELHDGAITVESRLGQGSTFTVILPLSTLLSG